MFRKISLAVLTAILVTTFCGCASDGGEIKEFKPPVYPPPPDKARFIYERTFRSSFDVKEITGFDKLKQFATGTAGTGVGLAKPYGVAVVKGRIFITDTISRHVLMLDVPGRKYKTIGTEGAGALVKPIGITVDRERNIIYVADNTAKRIVAYDIDGNYLRAIGGESVLRRPTGVTVSKDGSRLFVVDTGGVDTQEHHVYVFDTTSGELMQTIGKRGKELGEFNLPLQAATGTDGTIYVVDGGNFRVQAFYPDGTFKEQFGGVGTRSGQFSRPKGIATGPDGNIYVVDTGFANFQIFNPKAELLTYVGDKGRQGIPGEFLLPAGIDVDEDGRVYIVDQFFRKVEVFRPFDMKMSDGWLSSRSETDKAGKAEQK